MTWGGQVDRTHKQDSSLFADVHHYSVGVQIDDPFHPCTGIANDWTTLHSGRALALFRCPIKSSPEFRSQGICWYLLHTSTKLGARILPSQATTARQLSPNHFCHSSVEGYMTNNIKLGQWWEWEYTTQQKSVLHLGTHTHTSTHTTRQAAFFNNRKSRQLVLISTAHECHNEDNWVVRFNCPQRFPLNTFPL